MSFKNLILSKSGQYNHYKNSAESLKRDNENLKKENEKAIEENRNLQKQTPHYNLDEGISVIIPSYRGEGHIRNLLESFENQTLEPEYFELLFIINGPRDSTESIIMEFMDRNPDFNVTINYLSAPSESKARNVGLSLVSRQYTTFIDDDDFVSPNYLKKLLEYSRPNRVVMANFIDIDENTHEEIESRLVPFSGAKEKKVNGLTTYFGLTLVNVAKSFPSSIIKTQQFNTKLNNGIDVSFYSRLITRVDFDYYFIEKKEEATYYRLIRSGSLSRQDVSFQFNILDRLDVIEDINSCLKNETTKKFATYLETAIRSQAKIMLPYLEEYPDEKENVINEIRKHDLEYFPMNIIEDFEK